MLILLCGHASLGKYRAYSQVRKLLDCKTSHCVPFFKSHSQITEMQTSSFNLEDFHYLFFLHELQLQFSHFHTV